MSYILIGIIRLSRVQTCQDQKLLCKLFIVNALVTSSRYRQSPLPLISQLCRTYAVGQATIEYPNKLHATQIKITLYTQTHMCLEVYTALAQQTQGVRNQQKTAPIGEGQQVCPLFLCPVLWVILPIFTIIIYKIYSFYICD